MKEVMKMIVQLQAGQAVPESAFASLQSGLSEDEGSDEDDADDDDEGEGEGDNEEGDKGDAEAAAEGDGGDDEGLEEGEPEKEKVAPVPKVKKLLHLPSGKGAKSGPNHSPDPTLFPEIRPSKTASGSGRSPEEIELSQCLIRIQTLENDLQL